MSWDLWITVKLAEKTKFSVTYQRTKFSFRALNTWISRQTLKVKIILVLGCPCKSRTTADYKLTQKICSVTTIVKALRYSSHNFPFCIQIPHLYLQITLQLYHPLSLMFLFAIHLFLTFTPLELPTDSSLLLPILPSELYHTLFLMFLLLFCDIPYSPYIFFQKKSLLMTCTTQLYKSSITNTMKV